jgi:Fe-S oxidoreductase
MLREVYPEIVADYDLEVKSYLEVLAEAAMPASRPLNKQVAVHDSCVYARYLGMTEQPRQLLAAAGTTVAEPAQAGKCTQCCGGPIEALYPEKARTFAEERLAQLTATGCKEVVAMCPICLQNLENAAGDNGVKVRDISDCLSDAFLVEGDDPRE